MDTEDLVKVLVGLGNPGGQYERNRHNIGFMVLDALAREASAGWSPGAFSRICRIQISGFPVLLALPLTYMNCSGKAVQALLSENQRGPRDLLVVVDDLNLPFGRIRIREQGSAGGHHGLESIFTVLETEEIARIRIGIGEEPMPEVKADFVLSDFPPDKQAELNELITRAGNAVKSVLNDGISKTMAIFNAS